MRKIMGINHMKKLYIILIIILDLLIPGLVALSLLVFNVPDFIYILVSSIIIVLNIMLFRCDGKKVGKIVLSIISFIFISSGFAGVYCNPYWNTYNFRNTSLISKAYDYELTKNEALEDLEYAMKKLRSIHPVFYYNTNKQIEDKYEMVKKEIESKDKVTVAYLEARIESILSLLGDAHTKALGNYSEYHIMKETSHHNNNGDKLTKINGIGLKELWNSKKNLFSYEMEEAGFKEFCDQLVLLEELTKMDISVDKIVYTYDNNGIENDYTYTKDDFLIQSEYYKYNNIEINKESKEFVYYEIDKDNDVAILTLDECINNDLYKTTIKDMFKEIKDNNINNVAVDLRNNGGGNSSVATEFIKYLNVDEYLEWAYEERYGLITIENKEKTIKNEKYNDEVFNGNVYVLTSIDSFSSAMNFAMYIKDNNIGKVIGETSSNNPNSYGDITIHLLPNSKIYMQISYKTWHRISTVKDEEFVEPNIKCNSKEAINVLYKTINNM